MKPKPDKWQPPPMGRLKLNVDACFLETSGEGATGLILRNHAGVLIRGQVAWYAQAANALIMEALAVNKDGLKLVSELGLRNVIVETDASEVVKLWRNRDVRK